MSIIKTTITSDCTCEIYDEETDSTMLDEYGDPKRPDYCYGDCYTESVYDFTENLLKPYAEATGWQLDHPIKVEVSSIGWQRRSGYTFTTLEGLVETLQIDGDFRIQFEYDDEEQSLTAIRYSHDEPTGTGTFTIEHYLPCVKCGDPVPPAVYEEELEMCVQCSHDYFDHKDE